MPKIFAVKMSTLAVFCLALLLLSCSGDFDNETSAKDAYGPGDLLDDLADDDTTGDDDADDDADDDVDDDADDDMDDDLELKGFNVLYFDVGLGDAMLISIPDGPDMHYVLIDGGTVGEGQYAICPVLEELGIDALDIMIMTHPHFDHCGGLSELFDCVEIMELWENGDELPGDDGYDVYDLARNGWSGDVFYPNFGYVEYIGQAALRVLSTLADFSRVNDNSMVLSISYSGKTFLFGADAEIAEQSYLMAAWPDLLPSDVLKVPCHAGPSIQGFIDGATAPVGIVSVGENSLGYPHQATLDAYEATGMDLYITEETGNILATINEDDEIVLTMPFPPLEESQGKNAASLIPFF